MKKQKVIEVSESGNIIIGKVKEGYFFTDADLKDLLETILYKQHEVIDNSLRISVIDVSHVEEIFKKLGIEVEIPF